MNTSAVDPMLTNSIGSTFSATFQLRGSMEGGIDGLDLDFSDNLDIDDHMFDDIFPEYDHINNDDSFRDRLTTFPIPDEAPPADVVSSERVTPTPANMETDHFQTVSIGSTSTHSGLPSMMNGEPISMPRPRPLRRQTVDSAPAFTQEQIQQMGRRRRRISTASAPDPEFMSELMDIRNHGQDRGFDEFGQERDHHNMSGHHLPRVCSESVLCQTGDLPRRNSHFQSPDFSEEPLVADINLAVQQAQEKILHLKGLLGNRQQGLVSDVVGGNNHPHAHGQMSHQYQPAPPNNRPMRRASETGMPWTPQCAPPPPPPQHFQQMQQAYLQQITMAKLQAAMERTSSTEKLLQDWDRANGLPASHCQTMVNTSRSRKQLTEGVVLKKWNGSPLLNESYH
ncbi:hypothetical protein ACHAWT_004312 [Skeletonema menzelii]